MAPTLEREGQHTYNGDREFWKSLEDRIIDFVEGI